MKITITAALLTLALIAVASHTGCSSYVTSDQVAGLQNQVNSLSSSLTSTQQQLASTQQQLNSAQQSLSEAQAKLQQQQQQTTYTTSAQPGYQSTVIYRTYSAVYPYRYYYYSGYPWYVQPYRPVPPAPIPSPHPVPAPGGPIVPAP